MEQTFSEMHEVPDEGLVQTAPQTLRHAGGMRCELPLGQAMECGNARQRECRAPDSEILAGGARNGDVWLVRSGILRLQRHAYDGRRQILSLFFPGEIIGFDEDFREGVAIETATPANLCRIDRRWFDRMVQRNAQLRDELFRQKQDQLDRLHWLTWSLGALRPEERLAAFLAFSTKVMPYQTLPDGTGILSWDLPRKDTADLLGTTPETISRIIHKLADTGMIEIRDPAHFRFLDLPGLIVKGKISGHFGRMCNGRARRRAQMESLLESRSESSVCFCGRGPGALTPVNDARPGLGHACATRNLPSGGTGK